ncbi:glycine cleavage system protein GcvH [candidate division KSB3 bacterium]|uniref:Glycine cleavage system H protein n=1 Tax=candidate division KSB3 bacterium TaxID=2044937 RepID=A0A9D5JWX3_9BACT|nr:glycine cleavage system protein GcvH [candidate division KSB3 bacterium]
MKDLSTFNFPDGLLYTKDHEWARSDGEKVVIGITDYAQDQLGDIVFVDLPEPGDTFDKGDEFGTVESVKAVSEIYLPIGGEVLAVNSDLEDSSELVNEDPYQKGWMVEVQPSDPSELDDLMDKEAYLEFVKQEEEG